MEYARDLILTLTILALVFIADHWPKPAKAAEVVPYCQIDFLAAYKDQAGQWHKVWATGYGPCSLQDKYFEI